MITVHKYPIEINDHFSLWLPLGAKILTVDIQYGQPQLWALVDPKAPSEERIFRFAGTGHPIKEPIDQLEFVGTFQMEGGSLIFHVFEIKRATA